MKKVTTSLKSVLLLGAFTLFLTTSCKKETDSKEVAEEVNEEVLEKNEPLEDDSEYVVDATAMNQMQVEMGRLAQTKSTDADVKAYATTLVDYHTKANEELAAAATKLGITIPQTLSTEDADHVAALGKKSGTEFDKDFASMMVKHHDEAVEDAKEAAEKTNNPELKAWFVSTVGELTSHKEAAKALEDKLKNKK